MHYEDREYCIGSAMTLFYNFFDVKQEYGESLVNYSKRFKNAKDIKDDLCGSFNVKHALSRNDECNDATQSDQKDRAMEAIGQAEAYQFSMGCTLDKAVQVKKESQ